MRDVGIEEGSSRNLPALSPGQFALAIERSRLGTERDGLTGDITFQLAGVMTGNETGNLHCRRDNADVKSREKVLFQTYVFAGKCIHMTIC